MTTKMKHIIDQYTSKALAEFCWSRLKDFFVTGVLSDPTSVNRTGYNSATSRGTVLKFQRREIPIQTTQNLIIFRLNINKYPISLSR